MSFPNPINILNQGKSYIGQVASYVKTPTKLLANTSLSWLSGTTLSKMEGRGDPLFNNFWTVQLPAVPLHTKVNEELLKAAGKYIDQGLSAVGSGADWLGNTLGFSDSTNESIDSAISSARDTVKNVNMDQVQQITLGDEYVESITLVNKQYESREVFRAGAMYKYPDVNFTIDDLNIVLYGDKNLKSFRYAQNWIELINGSISQNLSHGAWTIPKKYKKEIIVGVADENLNELYLVHYLGCWLKSMDQIELSSDSDDYLAYNLTFSVDNIRVDGYDLQSFTESLMNYAGALGTNVISKAVDDYQSTVSKYTSTILNGII